MRLLRIKQNPGGDRRWMGHWSFADGKMIWLPLRDHIPYEITPEQRALNAQAVAFLLYTMDLPQITMDPVRTIKPCEIRQADNIEKRLLKGLGSITLGHQTGIFTFRHPGAAQTYIGNFSWGDETPQDFGPSLPDTTPPPLFEDVGPAGPDGDDGA